MQALAWLPIVCNATGTADLACQLTPAAVGKPLPAFQFQLSEDGPPLVLPLEYLVVNGS